MAFDASLLEPVDEKAGGFDPSLLEPIEESPQPAQRAQLSEWTPTIGNRLKMAADELGQQQPFKTIGEIPETASKIGQSIVDFAKASVGKNPDHPLPPSPLSSIEVPSGAELTRDTGLPPVVTETASAIDKTVMGLASFVTSPQGAEQMATYGVPVLKLPMAAKWISDMIKGGYLNIVDAVDAFKKGDTQRLRDNIIGATANFEGALGVGGGEVKSLKDYFGKLSDLETVAPPASREAPAPMTTRDAIEQIPAAAPILTGASLYPLPKGATPKEPNALQEPSTGTILQREPSQVGETGSQRVGVEQGQQGTETAQAQAGEDGLPQTIEPVTGQPIPEATAEEIAARVSVLKDHPIYSQFQDEALQEIAKGRNAKEVENNIRFLHKINQELVDALNRGEEIDPSEAKYLTKEQLKGVEDSESDSTETSPETPPAKPQEAKTASVDELTKTLNYSPEDLAKYKELGAIFSKLSESEPGSPEHMRVWQEYENLRNKYNGNQPKQIVESPQPEVESKNAPVAESVATPTAESNWSIKGNAVGEGILPEQQVTHGQSDRVRHNDGRVGTIKAEAPGGYEVEWRDGTTSFVTDTEVTRARSTTTKERNVISISRVGESYQVSVTDKDGKGKTVAVHRFNHGYGSEGDAINNANKSASEKSKKLGYAGYFEQTGPQTEVWRKTVQSTSELPPSKPTDAALTPPNIPSSKPPAPEQSIPEVPLSEAKPIEVLPREETAKQEREEIYQLYELERSGIKSAGKEANKRLAVWKKKYPDLWKKEEQRKIAIEQPTPVQPVTAAGGKEPATPSEKPAAPAQEGVKPSASQDAAFEAAGAASRHAWESDTVQAHQNAIKFHEAAKAAGNDAEYHNDFIQRHAQAIEKIKSGQSGRPAPGGQEAAPSVVKPEGKARPMNMAGQVRQPRPAPTPVGLFESLPQKSRDLFESAMTSRDPKAMSDLLQLNNRVLRSEFVKRTGVELPKTVGGTKKAVSDFFSKPTESPISAAAKVADQIQAVAKTEGQRPAKEVKSELVSRVEDEMDKAIDESETTIRPRGEEAPNEWLASSKSGAAYGTIEKVGNKFKASAQRPGYNLHNATFDTLEDAQWFIKALASSAEGKVTINIPGDGDFTIVRSGDTMVDFWKKAKSLDVRPDVPAKKSGVGTPATPEKVAAAYGSPEKAYQATRRQAAQLEDAGEKADAEKFAEEIYKNTEAAKLEAQAEHARDSERERKNSMDEAQVEIDRIMGLKRQTKAHLESVEQLKKEVESNKERMEFFGRSAETLEQQAAKEKAKLESGINPEPPEMAGPGSPSIPQGPGARTFKPSEKPESYEATSLKNAVAELERAGLGLPESTPAEKQVMAEAWIRAGDTISKNPMAGKELADKIIANPKRGLTGDESALLLRHKTSVFNALNDAAEKTVVGDAGSRLEAKTQYANLTDEFNTLLDAIKSRGSEWGREGRWRQAMAYEDYTMATQERLLKASLGRDLTVPERENLIRQIAEHKRLTEQLQQHLAQRDQKIAEMEVKVALDKVALEAKQQPTYHPSIMAAAEKIVVGFENRAKVASVRLREKLMRASAGLDPTIVLDVAEIGAGKLARFSLDAAKWSKAMLDEYGPKIEPYLKQGYEDAKKFLETNLSKVKGANAEKIKRAVRGTDFEEKKAVIADNIGKKIASGKRGEITNAVQRLARLFVEQGVKTRDGLIDAVHGFISEIDPTITRRDAMDAISGYGDFKQLTKDEISVQLRDLKGQMQQVAKLEDMQAGKPPVKTGVERRTPSREESKLIQQVNDTKRKFQIPVDDPNTQLRSPLDELKKRMQTRIADLTEKMAAGDYSRKPASEPIKLDATAIKLQADKIRAEKTFKHNRMLAEAAQRKWWQKGLDTFVKWERAFKLSSPVVFGKLGAAALTRVGATALEEPLGGVLSKVPGISRVAARAPREGGLNVRAMAHGITEAFNRGIDDAWQTAKKGGADIDVAYGDKILDKDWANFFGQLHGMMKAPIKRAEFTLSLDKRVQHAIANGIDVTDPMVQTRLATEALNDGYRSIFMQRGFSSDMFNQAVGMMEKSKKYPVAGEVTARLARFLMPVVRVPLNILGETATGIYGTPVASARTMFHAVRGTLDTLDPVVADSIMRQFKKGSIGLALMAIGYFNSQNVGGYDWRQKRKPGEVKTSGFQIGGVDIPRWATHAPWFELMQIGATIRRVSDEHISHTSTDKGFTIGAKAAMLGLVEESPFIGQILRADKVFGTDSEQTQYWGQLAQSTVDPQLLIQAAKLSDLDKNWSMIQRKPKTIGQYIETGIPGLRQNVPEKGGGSTYYGPTPTR